MKNITKDSRGGTTMKKLGTAVAMAATIASGNSQAANWLMLQGTEDPGSAPRAKVWGFIQPEYQYTKGTELQSGPWKGQDAVFNLIGPDLDSSSTFQLRRARIGVRGTGFGLDSGVNYFILAEMGNNAITQFGGGGAVKLTDASVTLNYIPHARIRVGQFKYPGAEEGLQAIHVFNYVNYTNITKQQLLERFFDEDGSRGGLDRDVENEPNGSIGAFREVPSAPSATSASRCSTPSPWTSGNTATPPWWATATASTAATTTAARTTISTGLRNWCSVARRHAARVGSSSPGIRTASAPWTMPTAKRGSRISTVPAGALVPPTSRASGAARVLPQLELDVRYDYEDRGTETDLGERELETWTIGAQWFFNKKARAIVNYEFRDFSAPGYKSSAPPNEILDGVDDRFSVQLLAIF